MFLMNSAAHVVEIHAADGLKVIELPSKRAAHALGMKLRREGATCFVFAANSPFRASAPKSTH